MKLSIFSLKIEILLGFLSLGSKLFHSIIADEKKQRIFEKCMLYLNKGILSTVLIAYGILLTGVRLKRYSGCSFLKTL